MHHITNYATAAAALNIWCADRLHPYPGRTTASIALDENEPADNYNGILPIQPGEPIRYRSYSITNELAGFPTMTRPDKAGRRADVPADVDPLRVRSLKQAATAANISVPTLRRLIRSGQGPKTIQLSERRLGVRDRDFFAWLETRRAV